jgi:parallel beta-helix repeat protein
MQSSSEQFILELLISMILISTFFSGLTVRPIETASCTRAAGYVASSALAWNKTYGGTGSDFALALVQTVDGGCALAGRTYSFGAGSSDIWLVKTDASGNHLWNRTYGGTGEDRTSSLVQTVDGGYALAGTTYSFGAGSSDIWLVKTDESGNHLWNRTYGGIREDDPAHFVVQTVDGGYALAGRTYSFGAGSSDMWLIKTDAGGNRLWDRTYGGTSVDGVFAFVQTVDGGYALAGHTNSFGAGNYDFWLVKTDSAGNMVWNRTYGGTNEDWAYALIQTADEGYALIGETWSFGGGNSDVWLVRTDAFGNHLWNKTYGGTSVDGVFAFVQTVDGGYALAGHTYSFGAGSCDAWLVKTDAFGNHEWNETYGGIAEDYACRLIPTANDSYVLAGSTGSFGAGSDDFWLVRTVGVTFIIVPDDYSSIQEAVNNAIEGDVIFVRSGVYYEHVVVNKTVSLLGEDVSMAIVDGSGTGNVFAIDKDGVNITGFTVQKSGGILGNAGIRLDNVSLCSISGNRIRDNFAGIWFEEASENLITANEITANVDDGMVFNYSHNNTISENQIALHEYFGIVINWSCNNTICCNNVTQTYGPSHGDGINLWRSSGNSIFQNRVEDNARYGIRIETQSNNNTLSDNTIRNCTTGLQVYDYSNYNYIYGNSVAQCSDGVDVNQYSTQNVLLNNTISDNVVTGIQVYRAENNQIDSNHLVNNWGGIGVHGQSHHNYIRGNRIENCTNGLILHDSDYNEICSSRITECDIGIHFEWLTNFNIIKQNNIMNNERGIRLEETNGNIFYHNHMVANTIQVSIIGYAADTWDDGYPAGGNYWSDYNGTDSFTGPYQNETGSDRIGDTPYTIDASNIDNYDGVVDIFDAILLANAFDSVPGDSNWNPNADLNNDDVVDIFDAIILANSFGKTT